MINIHTIYALETNTYCSVYKLCFWLYKSKVTDKKPAHDPKEEQDDNIHYYNGKSSGFSL